jgi:hypothetical protein
MMVRFLAALTLVAASCLGFSADKEVEELLAKMRAAYQAVESVSIQAKAKARYPQGEESHSISMDYAKTNKLRLTFDFRGKTVRRISDGKTVYTWAEDTKTAKRTDVDEAKVSMDALGGDAPINLESMCFFDWKRQLSTAPGANMEKSEFKLIALENWNGRSWMVLEETAHGQSVFARYFIDPKTHFIWRCDVKTLKERKTFMDVQIVRMTLNPKLGPDTFKAPFEKPL